MNRTTKFNGDLYNIYISRDELSNYRVDQYAQDAILFSNLVKGCLNKFKHSPVLDMYEDLVDNFENTEIISKLIEKLYFEIESLLQNTADVNFDFIDYDVSSGALKLYQYGNIVSHKLISLHDLGFDPHLKGLLLAFGSESMIHKLEKYQIKFTTIFGISYDTDVYVLIEKMKTTDCFIENFKNFRNLITNIESDSNPQFWLRIIQQVLQVNQFVKLYSAFLEFNDMLSQEELENSTILSLENIARTLAYLSVDLMKYSDRLSDMYTSISTRYRNFSSYSNADNYSSEYADEHYINFEAFGEYVSFDLENKATIVDHKFDDFIDLLKTIINDEILDESIYEFGIKLIKDFKYIKPIEGITIDEYSKLYELITLAESIRSNLHIIQTKLQQNHITAIYDIFIKNQNYTEREFVALFYDLMRTKKESIDKDTIEAESINFDLIKDKRQFEILALCPPFYQYHVLFDTSLNPHINIQVSIIDSISYSEIQKVQERHVRKNQRMYDHDNDAVKINLYFDEYTTELFMSVLMLFKKYNIALQFQKKYPGLFDEIDSIVIKPEYYELLTTNSQKLLNIQRIIMKYPEFIVFDWNLLAEVSIKLTESEYNSKTKIKTKYFKTLYSEYDVNPKLLDRLMLIPDLTLDDVKSYSELYNNLLNSKKIHKILKPVEFKSDKYSLKLLSHDDPDAILAGEFTSCCQTISEAASACVTSLAKYQNTSILAFYYEDQLVLQSWIWVVNDILVLDSLEGKPAYLTQYLKLFRQFYDKFSKKYEIRIGNTTYGVTNKLIKLLGSEYNIKHVDPIDTEFIKMTGKYEIYNSYYDAHEQLRIKRKKDKK